MYAAIKLTELPATPDEVMLSFAVLGAILKVTGKRDGYLHNSDGSTLPLPIVEQWVTMESASFSATQTNYISSKLGVVFETAKELHDWSGNNDIPAHLIPKL